MKWDHIKKRKLQQTIEHIFPETPTDKYWANNFAGYNKKEKKALMNSLGNLLLLSRSKNSSLQNYSFPRKKRYMDDRKKVIGYVNGSYSEIEVASNEQWLPNDILDRGIVLLNFIEERWNIFFEDWDIDKRDILYLSFL